MINNISEIENKIKVEEKPFSNAICENFIPLEIAKNAEKEFYDFDKTIDFGNARYQKLKRGFSDYYSKCQKCKRNNYFFLF